MKNIVMNRAYELFISGLNCAESVFQAVIEKYEEGHDNLYKIASPFGGGVGSTRLELCGALTGGVMAFGWLHGRSSENGDDSRSKAMAGQLREKMALTMKTTQCQALVDQFGEVNRREQCARLVADTAGWAVEILEESQSKGELS